MSAFFLNPWAMVFGGLLISAPILIHLLNRMRFRRLRWAAMEFLLKAQKKMRRRMIIEQLILLLLRILLVLLIAFLMARFVAAKTRTDDGTTHYILIDDTLSMADTHRQDNVDVSAFDKGQAEVMELVKTLAKADSFHTVCLMKLSDLEKPLFENQIKPSAVSEVQAAVDTLKPTALHVAPGQGIKAAADYLRKVPKGSKVLHFFSDFREKDWVSSAAANQLAESIDKMVDDSVNVNFIDPAHPYRAEARGQAAAHENVAIIGLRADTRVAAENVPVEFTVTIENFGNLAKTQDFLHVRVNGAVSFGAEQPIPVLPAMQRTEIRFPLQFAKSKATEAVTEKDAKAERDRKRRIDREFQTVTVEIEDKNGGLIADNIRELVIEVRHKVPLLILDGNDPKDALESGSDYSHLREAFKAARAYEVERRPFSELETTELDLYPTIFLVNVSQIKGDANLKKIQDYVKSGGNLVYCVGDKTEAGFYNNKLHKEMGGLFPVMIANAPTVAMTDAQKEAAQFKDPQPKLLMPKMDTEFSEVLRNLQPQFRWMLIDRYYPTLDRSQWATGTENSQVLMYLANRKPVSDFAQRAQDLGREATKLTGELAEQEKEYEKYIEPISQFNAAIRTALAEPFLYQLVRVLDAVLKDPGIKDDPNRPSMPDLWAHKKMRRLARDLEEFREKVEFGDPLVVANTYGKGKVVAFLTTAGTLSKWNEWGGGNPVSFTYEVFMMDLQRYLIGDAEGLNRGDRPRQGLVGSDPLLLEFDGNLYESAVKVRFKEQKPTPPRDENTIIPPAGDAPKDVDPAGPEIDTVTMKEPQDRAGHTGATLYQV